MKFLLAIGSGFRGYFNFLGVAGRLEFWAWTVFANVLGIPLLWLGALKIQNLQGGLFAPWYVVLLSDPLGSIWGAFAQAFIWYAVLLVPSVALAVRRLRQAGLGSWRLLILAVPYLILVAEVIAMVQISHKASTTGFTGLGVLFFLLSVRSQLPQIQLGIVALNVVPAIVTIALGSFWFSKRPKVAIAETLPQPVNP